ncbi:MAG: hypothetical protein QMD25_02745 [Caldisericia bacterium]|nr:hypothetical protein [Caldisericia bacterium]
MPFTPFHWGPSSWIGIILFKIFDLPTLVVASVIVDIEPFCVFVFNAPWRAHGFLHSFLGGSIIATLTAIFIYFLKNKIRKIMSFFKLSQNSPFKKILWTSFFGIYFHILLDSPLYSDITPFYPLKTNPLYGKISSRDIYLFCSLSFIVGLFAYLIKLWNYKKNFNQIL